MKWKKKHTHTLIDNGKIYEAIDNGYIAQYVFLKKILITSSSSFSAPFFQAFLNEFALDFC